MEKLGKRVAENSICALQYLSFVTTVHPTNNSIQPTFWVKEEARKKKTYESFTVLKVSQSL